MNGIEKVIARIISDAEAEASATLDRAREEARKVTESFQLMAQREYDELVAVGSDEAARYEARLVSNAKMDMSKDQLSVKQQLVAEALAKALDMLSKLPENDYIALLASLCVKASETGREEVILSAADNRRYGEQVVERANALLREKGSTAELSLSADTRAMVGGIILKNHDIEVNCSLEALVYSNREEYSTLASGMLFD